MRTHEVVWEALSRLRWCEFQSFLDSCDSLPFKVEELTKTLEELTHGQDTRENIVSLLQSEDFKSLVHCYKTFCQLDHGLCSFNT